MAGCETKALSREAPVTLVPSLVDWLQPISCVMTAPTFQSFMTLLCGWVFARRCTVTGMILAAGAVGDKHHSAYHRVFSAARWSLDELGLAVFGLIAPLLATGPTLLAIDDTLARKRGHKVFGVGMHHDPLISTRKMSVSSWGHCWVVLGVVLKLPFCGDRWFCLPVLFRLYVPRKTADKKRLPYYTKPQLAVQLLRVLCDHFETRRFHAIGDSAYGGKSVLLELPGNCDLTSRLKMDARLYDAPTPRKRGKRGRPPVRGKRLPTPLQMLEGRRRHLTLDIYGRRDKSRVAECLARVYAAPGRLLKVVAVQPLQRGPHRPGVLFDLPERQHSGGPGPLRGQVVDRGELSRGQGPTRVRAAPGLEQTGGEADGAGGDALVFAGGSVVQPRRPSPLLSADAPVVHDKGRRTGTRIVRRHAQHPAVPERQTRGFIDAPARQR
jgi:hypothetical protein